MASFLSATEHALPAARLPSLQVPAEGSVRGTVDVPYVLRFLRAALAAGVEVSLQDGNRLDGVGSLTRALPTCSTPNAVLAVDQAIVLETMSDARLGERLHLVWPLA